MSAGATTIVRPAAPLSDDARLAIAGFLARYTGATRNSYAADLRQYFSWCAQHDLGSSPPSGGHIEPPLRRALPRGIPHHDQTPGAVDDDDRTPPAAPITHRATPSRPEVPQGR